MINSSSPILKTGADVAQRTSEQNLTNVSQETNTDTHQVVDFDNPSSKPLIPPTITPSLTSSYRATIMDPQNTSFPCDIESR